MNDEADPSPAPDPAPPEDEEPPAPPPEPPTVTSPPPEPRSMELSEELKARLEQHYLRPGQVDQLAAAAAERRAGHVGRHHWAGHASGRAPWAACGEWRPIAGVTCPVCPDTCPGCGARYVNPFPVDPRDG